MKNEGYKVDCQKSGGGIYISVYLDYVNKFPTTEDYINFLTLQAKMLIKEAENHQAVLD
jgi:hypothetical protein